MAATLKHFAGDPEIGGLRVTGGPRTLARSLEGLSNRTKNKLLIG